MSTLVQRQARSPIFVRRFSKPTHDRNVKTIRRLRISDSFAVPWFAAFNVVTFIAFGFDKWRAGGSNSRVPESCLSLLGALGGWPGGLLALSVFRHKTAKWSFQLKYDLALIPFAAEVWAWRHWR